MAKTKNNRRRSAKSRSQGEVGGVISKAATMVAGGRRDDNADRAWVADSARRHVAVSSAPTSKQVLQFLN